MQKFIWLLLATLLLFLPGCGNDPVVGSGKIVTDTRPVSGVRAVSFDGGGSLVITQGVEEGITIEADDNVLPHISTAVDGGVLTLTPDAAVSPSRPIVYRLTVRDVEAVTLDGSGNISIGRLESETIQLRLNGSGQIVVDEVTATTLALQIEGSGRLLVDEMTVDTLTVRLEGSGDVTAAGRATAQTVTVDGSGRYRAGALASETATVSVEGSGNATVWGRDRLAVAVDGDGRVAYYGQPIITSEQIMGEATLVPLGNKAAAFSGQSSTSEAEAEGP